MAACRCDWRRCGSLVGLVALASCLLMGSGSASASTTIGQLSTPNVICVDMYTYLQTGSSGPTYTVPSSGVITSWSFENGPSAIQGLKLKVGRPAGAGNYTIVGESAAGLKQVSNSTISESANIPVKAGDVIGIYRTGGDCATTTTSGADRIGANKSDVLPLTTAPFTGVVTSIRLPVSATITAPPTSTVSLPGCPAGGPVTGTVTADSGTTPKALHYKVDGGAEQVAPTIGDPGTTSITLPGGVHSLEFWGEDQLGQQESPHHTATVGCSVISSTPVTPAHISGVTVTNKTFSVSARPQLPQFLFSARRRPPVGTTFKFTLDKAAAIRLDFTQPGQGRKVKGRCVAQNKRNKRKPKCAVIRGSLSFTGHSGLNTVRFKGWLSKRKRLKPGRYTLVITATTPGAGSTSQKLKFTIVK